MISRHAKEIEMLMVMGATRPWVLKIFLQENLLLSPSASVLGFLLVFAFAKLITLYSVDVAGSTSTEIQMIIIARPEYFFYAVVFAAALNFISGIFPANIAAGLDPVEAIESE
jgi:lipoprotein-releasing system permease protein